MFVHFSSASPLLALLDDPVDQVRAAAIEKLVSDEIVNAFWPELADALPKLEKLAKTPSFVAQKMTSLLISKVFLFFFFFLGSHLFFKKGLLSFGKLSQKHEFCSCRRGIF